MKKVLVLFSICASVIACNSSDNGAKPAEDKKPAESTASKTSDAATDEKALEMIGALDCTTCHKISEKSIGPAYTEVANKYPEATKAVIDDLAGKIIKGGQGVYGQVPMTPHPTLSMDSARLMVKYILTLKDKK